MTSKELKIISRAQAAGQAQRRYEVFCKTAKCTWAGNWDDTSASRIANGQIVECDPHMADAESCCPKCLLANLVETNGWADDQLPQRAFYV